MYPLEGAYHVSSFGEPPTKLFGLHAHSKARLKAATTLKYIIYIYLFFSFGVHGRGFGLAMCGI
jgi:hypothetical protein